MPNLRWMYPAALLTCSTWELSYTDQVPLTSSWHCWLVRGESRPELNGRLDCMFAWQVHFRGSKQSPADEGVTLSTAPSQGYTHWGHTVHMCHSFCVLAHCYIGAVLYNISITWSEAWTQGTRIYSCDSQEGRRTKIECRHTIWCTRWYNGSASHKTFLVCIGLTILIPWVLSWVQNAI